METVKLPSDALIASEKLTKYLLVKRLVGDKSEFLRQAGYAVDNWQQLEQDIRQQILSRDAISIEQTDYGEVFEIRASLTGPNGVIRIPHDLWPLSVDASTPPLARRRSARAVFSVCSPPVPFALSVAQRSRRAE